MRAPSLGPACAPPAVVEIEELSANSLPVFSGEFLQEDGNQYTIQLIGTKMHRFQR